MQRIAVRKEPPIINYGATHLMATHSHTHEHEDILIGLCIRWNGTQVAISTGKTKLMPFGHLTAVDFIIWPLYSWLIANNVEQWTIKFACDRPSIINRQKLWVAQISWSASMSISNEHKKLNAHCHWAARLNDTIGESVYGLIYRSQHQRTNYKRMNQPM